MGLYRGNDEELTNVATAVSGNLSWTFGLKARLTRCVKVETRFAPPVIERATGMIMSKHEI